MTNQFPNNQGFLKHVFGQKKSDFFCFFFAAIKISRSSLLFFSPFFFDIYILYNSARIKQNQELRFGCQF